jgi:hypothetical protein
MTKQIINNLKSHIRWYFEMNNAYDYILIQGT